MADLKGFYHYGAFLISVYLLIGSLTHMLQYEETKTWT